MSISVLFYDPVCPSPYDPETLATKAQGGTESTVTRIAEGLASLGVRVTVAQHNRVETFQGRATYVPADYALKATHVILLRDPTSIYHLKQAHPRAKFYLWSHDLCVPPMIHAIPLLEVAQCDILTVSDYHKTQTTEMLKSGGYDGTQFRIQRVYNPIDDSLLPDETPYDKNKLVWLSSPHKGLDYALDVFQNLLRFNPDFTLHVYNPGYLPNIEASGLEGKVIVHPPAPYSDGINALRGALALFYPNLVFPETFGLVYAEANAVGTPAITHNLGAAQEVLDGHPLQIVDCRNPKALIERVMMMHRGERPIVRARSKFRLSQVLKDWMRNVLN